jgi:hypothetical protein
MLHLTAQEALRMRVAVNWMRSKAPKRPRRLHPDHGLFDFYFL